MRTDFKNLVISTANLSTLKPLAPRQTLKFEIRKLQMWNQKFDNDNETAHQLILWVFLTTKLRNSLRNMFETLINNIFNPN